MQRRHLLRPPAALALATALSACGQRPPLQPARGAGLPGPAPADAPRPGRPPAQAAGAIPGARPVPALRPGAVVAVLAPASPAARQAQAAAQWLTARGFVPRLHASALQQPQGLDGHEFPAAGDAERAQDLHAAFADPEVGAIVCLRGGYGSAQLLARLDWELLRRHPKPFVGYSDITALHLALAREAGFVTFHGPMLASDLLREPPEPTESLLWSLLQGRLGAGDWLPHPEPASLVPLRGGVAQGPLVGGNLALISALMGTRWEVATQGSILFIEDVGEAPYKIDRMLLQLQLAGKLEQVRGVLVGDFSDISADTSTPARREADARRLAQVLRERLLPLGVPVLAGWKSGHCRPNLTLPLGALVTLDADRGGLQLAQGVTTA